MADCLARRLAISFSAAASAMIAACAGALPASGQDCAIPIGVLIQVPDEFALITPNGASGDMALAMSEYGAEIVDLSPLDPDFQAMTTQGTCTVGAGQPCPETAVGFTEAVLQVLYRLHQAGRFGGYEHVQPLVDHGVLIGGTLRANISPDHRTFEMTLTTVVMDVATQNVAWPIETLPVTVVLRGRPPQQSATELLPGLIYTAAEKHAAQCARRR